jgi:hypothetical protein
MQDWKAWSIFEKHKTPKPKQRSLHALFSFLTKMKILV